mmetsp:Transcript_109807/g.321539  ORF Transcript_109807/g.321539 Transcript_109807/m.321539 type:complete len:242 (+) Transcript_109807:1157-1882(+)
MGNLKLYGGEVEVPESITLKDHAAVHKVLLLGAILGRGNQHPPSLQLFLVYLAHDLAWQLREDGRELEHIPDKNDLHAAKWPIIGANPAHLLLQEVKKLTRYHGGLVYEEDIHHGTPDVFVHAPGYAFEVPGKLWHPHTCGAVQRAAPGDVGCGARGTCHRNALRKIIAVLLAQRLHHSAQRHRLACARAAGDEDVLASENGIIGVPLPSVQLLHPDLFPRLHADMGRWRQIYGEAVRSDI